jgi:hypothetical protein
VEKINLDDGILASGMGSSSRRERSISVPLKKTSHITNINKLLPFIYITSPAPPASPNITYFKYHVSHCCQFNVTKLINNKKSGM